MSTPTVCFHAPWPLPEGMDELPPDYKPTLDTLEHRFVRIPLEDRSDGDAIITRMIHFFPMQNGWEPPEYYYYDERTRPATQIRRPARTEEIFEALQLIDRSFFVDLLADAETGKRTIVPWAFLTEEQRKDVVSALEHASSA